MDILKILVIFSGLFYADFVMAQSIDLSGANILVSSNINSPVKETAAKVLREEVARRTNIDLPLKNKIGKSAIILANISDLSVNGISIPKQGLQHSEKLKAEGFQIFVDEAAEKSVLWLIGTDDKSLIFAIGQFLRTAELANGKILFRKADEIVTSPVYKIRGHQLGYRNTANSYDAWSVAQYEQYIRELALFGTNAIENIPFHHDAPGPNMKVSTKDMNAKISEICNQYGLDYWVWTPTDVDLSDKTKFNAEVRKHIELYQQCPRLDGVFFPGGDPGENHPKYVMPFLHAIAIELKKYHPHAGVWVSLQGYEAEQVDYFYKYLEENKPDWLTGVVSGPGSPDLAATRFRLPSKYLHRAYPDITHTIRCQYPTKNWDQAYALTQGREVCNPQPFYYAKIHNQYALFTDGFISYSDGVHDDVNKIIWTQLAWNPHKEVRKVLAEYGRFFFGSTTEEWVADGILALERNWDGPLQANGAVETTFAYWMNLELAHPALSYNWRWQQLMMRCYYDTYIRRRQIYERGLEKEAMNLLLYAKRLGAEKVMDMALAKVNLADLAPVNLELKKKVVDYCAALFLTIGLQTSVEQYHASGPERGAILDFIDYPLNNRWWLADEFDKIREFDTEKEKLARLEVIRTWENPGPGSYYDNVSDINQEPHVLTRADDATDVAWWDKGKSRKRLSTQLFQNFPELVYTDLDPNGNYTIRISGYGDALLKVDGERLTPITYDKGLEAFKIFPIDRKYVHDGRIQVTFDQPDELRLNWRNHSKICDIWLLKE
ncbi:MAG: hypothetical protein ACOH2A_10265 [Sphingobacteriaceae bacterium]